MVESTRANVQPLLIDRDVMPNLEVTPFVLPSGTVTFLLTDVEGSTLAWQQHPAAMSAAIARHYQILGDSIARWGGVRPVEQARATASWVRSRVLRTHSPQHSMPSGPSRARCGPTAFR